MARKKKYNRSWHADRAYRKGGTNIRGNKRERWERSHVRGYVKKDGTRVKSYYRHKGKRR